MHEAIGVDFINKQSFMDKSTIDSSHFSSSNNDNTLSSSLIPRTTGYSDNSINTSDNSELKRSMIMQSIARKYIQAVQNDAMQNDTEWNVNILH